MTFEKFQFLNGTIRIFEVTCEQGEFYHISIPKWYD